MAALYIGRYRWPLPSPLRQLQSGRGTVVVFFPSAAETPAAQELLAKILASVKLSYGEAGLFVVEGSLTPERLRLFSERLVWVMGGLLPAYREGVYDLHTGKSVAPPAGIPMRGQWLYVLPGLTDMLQNPDRKKETWRWIRSLASQ